MEVRAREQSFVERRWWFDVRFATRFPVVFSLLSFLLPPRNTRRNFTFSSFSSQLGGGGERKPRRIIQCDGTFPSAIGFVERQHPTTTTFDDEEEKFDETRISLRLQHRLLFIISTVLNGDDQRVLLTRIKRADYSDINSGFSEAGKK